MYLVVKTVDLRIVHLVERLAELKVVEKAVKMVECMVVTMVDPLAVKKFGN